MSGRIVPPPLLVAEDRMRIREFRGSHTAQVLRPLPTTRLFMQSALA
jgi:hypothetical protein